MQYAQSNKDDLTPSQIGLLVRIFSSKVIHEFAKQGESRTFSRLIAESNFMADENTHISIGDFFDIVFNKLKKTSNRHEYTYKNAIICKVLLGTHSLNTATVLSEFRVDNSKADIVLLNGSSSVYEIKSERDNLNKLEKQVESYKKVFPKVSIVTGENHINDVLTLLPKNVGVILLNRKFSLTTVRKPVATFENICTVSIFDSLQRTESLKVLSMLGKAVPDVPNTRLYSEMRLIFEKCDPKDVHDCMVNVLKSTRSLASNASLISQLPYSLRAAAISTPICAKDHARLIDALKLPKEHTQYWV